MNRLTRFLVPIAVAVAGACSPNDPVDRAVTLELLQADGSCSPALVASISSVLVRIMQGGVQDGPCQAIASRDDLPGIARELSARGVRFESLPAGPLTIEVSGYGDAVCGADGLVLCGHVESELQDDLDRIVVPVRCADDPAAPELADCSF